MIAQMLSFKKRQLAVFISKRQSVRIILMLKFSICLVFGVLLGLGAGQFSHYVPNYLLDIPIKFVDATLGDRNKLDPYVELGPVSASIGYAANLNGPNAQVLCNYPLVFVFGGCFCPGGGRLIQGQCYGGTQQYQSSSGANSTNSGYGASNSVGQCPLLPIQTSQYYNSISALAQISRTYDGSQNNLQFPLWGATGAFLQRKAQNSYADGLSVPNKNLPNPRTISNWIAAENYYFKAQDNRLNVSMAFTIFGQFIDHDIDLTVAQNGPNAERMDISMPSGDPYFQAQSIDFTRSNFQANFGQPRKFKNFITSWVDGSQIYGSDPQTNCQLREFSGGRMKMSGGNLLYKVRLDSGYQIFKAGDTRAAENSILASYHTLWVREHNRLCSRILSQDPTLNEETVFQAARSYVIGLLQKITFKDFLPILLGDTYNLHIGNYQGYKPYTNPNIPTEFSTACFRFGHSLLNHKLRMISASGQELPSKNLSQLFFNQQLVTSENIDNILRGLSKTMAKERSSVIVDEIRNLLITDANQNIKLDLIALNIQRGRDHGLPTYNSLRRAVGLPAYSSFQQLVGSQNVALAYNLRGLYGTIDNMELFIGIICEQPVRNGILGELGARIVGETFRNLRDGDRLWYESKIPSSILQEIESTSLGQIFRRNSGAWNLPNDIFHVSW